MKRNIDLTENRDFAKQDKFVQNFFKKIDLFDWKVNEYRVLNTASFTNRGKRLISQSCYECDKKVITLFRELDELYLCPKCKKVKEKRDGFIWSRRTKSRILKSDGLKYFLYMEKIDRRNFVDKKLKKIIIDDLDYFKIQELEGNIELDWLF